MSARGGTALSALVGRLSASSKTVYDVRAHVKARANAMGDEVATRELVAELQRAVKDLGESRAASEMAAPECIREAVIYALHEVLTRVVADPAPEERALAEKLLPDVETLVARCVDHFSRQIVKTRDTGTIEAHSIKSAENLLKVLRTWKARWRAFHESEIIRNCANTLKKVVARGTEAKHQQQIAQAAAAAAAAAKPATPKPRRPSDAQDKPRIKTPEIPLVPLPDGFMQEAGPTSAMLMMSPPVRAASLISAVKKQEPKKQEPPLKRSSSSTVVQDSSSASSGLKKRFDVCRLLNDVCEQLRHNRRTKGAAFYFLHYFLRYAPLEPPEQAPKSVASARQAAERAKFGRVDDAKALALAREAYIAQLEDDELVALALASVHLAGKSTDAPQRISYVLEAVRQPQRGSATRRRWPAASPHREQVLLAEQRLLRCLCFDARTTSAEEALADLCPSVMDDEAYLKERLSERRAKNAAAPPGGMLSSATAAPPHEKKKGVAKGVAKRLYDTALDVASSLAFHASGLVVEHKPLPLVAASLLCAAKHSNWHFDEHESGKRVGLPETWLEEAAATCDTPKAQLRGLSIEIDNMTDELRSYFAMEKERPPLAVLKRKRKDAAKRAAQATLHRLCQESTGRYIARVSSANEALQRKQPVKGAPPDASTLRLMQDVDDCGIALYYSDLAELKELATTSLLPPTPAATSSLRRLPLLVTDEDFVFDFGCKQIFATSALLENPTTTDENTAPRYKPTLHVVWPRRDLEAIQGLSEKARDEALRTTSSLVQRLKEHTFPPVLVLGPDGKAPLSPHSRSLTAASSINNGSHFEHSNGSRTSAAEVSSAAEMMMMTTTTATTVAAAPSEPPQEAREEEEEQLELLDPHRSGRERKKKKKKKKSSKNGHRRESSSRRTEGSRSSKGTRRRREEEPERERKRRRGGEEAATEVKEESKRRRSGEEAAATEVKEEKVKEETTDKPDRHREEEKEEVAPVVYREPSAYHNEARPREEESSSRRRRREEEERPPADVEERRRPTEHDDHRRNEEHRGDRGGGDRRGNRRGSGAGGGDRRRRRSPSRSPSRRRRRH